MVEAANSAYVNVNDNKKMGSAYGVVEPMKGDDPWHMPAPSSLSATSSPKLQHAVVRDSSVDFSTP